MRQGDVRIDAKRFRRTNLSIPAFDSGFPWTSPVCHVTCVNSTHLGVSDRACKRPRMSFRRARRSVANERTSICKVAEFPKLDVEPEKTGSGGGDANLGIFSRANKRGGPRMRIYAARNEMSSGIDEIINIPRSDGMREAFRDISAISTARPMYKIPI